MLVLWVLPTDFLQRNSEFFRLSRAGSRRRLRNSCGLVPRSCARCGASELHIKAFRHPVEFLLDLPRG